jgi:NADH-quinone oxidoreductase subunit E
MLTPQEKVEIDQALHHVPVRKAAGIEALKIVQHHRRWISDETLRDVADYMQVSAEELDSVATFYNLLFRKPVGRHVILVCDSISCWVMGYEDVVKALEQKLEISFGQTTPDQRFTMLPNCCLGCCDAAPAFMIDGDLFRNVSVQQLDGILSKYE